MARRGPRKWESLFFVIRAAWEGSRVKCGVCHKFLIGCMGCGHLQILFEALYLVKIPNSVFCEREKWELKWGTAEVSLLSYPAMNHLFTLPSQMLQPHQWKKVFIKITQTLQHMKSQRAQRWVWEWDSVTTAPSSRMCQRILFLATILLESLDVYFC